MRRRILLADDSVTIQKVIELTFMDEDYDVKAVSNGDEALAALPEMHPDFVIADVHMPGANGYEVCRRSKELRPDLPVLLLVGTFEPFDEAQARAAGADSFLKKPFDSQELLQRVQDLLAPQGAAAPPAEEPAFDIPEGLPPLDLGIPEFEPAAPETDWSAFQLESSPVPEPLERLEPLAPLEPAQPSEPFPPSFPAAQPFAPLDESPFVFEEEQAVSAFEVEESVQLPAGEPMFDFESSAPEPLAEPALGDIDPPAEPPAAPRPAAGFAPWRQAENVAPEEGLGVPVGAAPRVDSLAETEARIEAPAPPFAAAHEPESTVRPEPFPEPFPEPHPQPHPTPSLPVTPPAAPLPVGSVSVNGDRRLSDDDVDRIARRVVELMGDTAVRDIAWEVIPDLAEVVIRDRLRELESQAETPAE